MVAFIAGFLQFLAIIMLIVYSVFLIKRIVVDYKNGKSFKKIRILGFFLPVIVLFCMFFQGTYRSLKINTDTIDSEFLTVVDSLLEENDNECQFVTDDYCLNISVYDENFHDLFFDTQFYNKNFIQKALGNTGVTGVNLNGSYYDHKYYVSELYSIRDSEGLRIHDSYTGTIILEKDDKTCYLIDVSVSRPVDIYFGWLFTAPILEKLDLKEVITAANLRNHE